MKYVPSAMIGQLSRSAGSTTASHNRNGAYFRNRTVPVNPNTVKQTTQRALIAALSAFWRSLTDSQRAAWIAFGANMTRVDSLGRTYTLSGLQAFTSVNVMRDVFGGATLSDPLTFSTPAVFVAGSVAVDDSANTMVLTFTPDPFPDTFIIQATAPVSQGINFRSRSAYKQVKTVAAATASPISFQTEYAAVFGAPAAGQKIFYRIIPVSDSFVMGTEVRFSAIVVA